MASECAGKPATRPLSTSAHSVLACSTSSGLDKQFGLQVLGAGAHQRIGGELGDQFLHGLAQFDPPGVLGIAHLDQRAEQAVEHFFGDHPVDPFGDPARGSLRHFFGEQVFVAREPRLALFDGLRQQRLRLALRPQDRQQLRGDRRRRNRQRRLLRDGPDRFADPLQRQRLGDVRQLQRHIVAQPLGIGRLGEPLGERAHHVYPRQALVHHRRGEEIIGDEIAQRLADPILVVGDDAGVRYRQAERAPEQCDDGEPVGAGADHAGFGERPQVGNPRPIEP